MSHTENDMIMGEGLAKKGINERKRRIGKENVENSDKKNICVWTLSKHR